MFSLTQHRRWNPFAFSLIQCTETLLRNNTCRTLPRAPNLGTKHKKSTSQLWLQLCCRNRGLWAWLQGTAPIAPGAPHSPGGSATLQNPVPATALHPAGTWGCSGVLNYCRRSVPDGFTKWIYSPSLHQKDWGLGRVKDLSLQCVQNTTAPLPWNLCSPGFIPGVTHKLGEVLSFASPHLTLSAGFYSFMHLLPWHNPACPKEWDFFLFEE